MPNSKYRPAFNAAQLTRLAQLTELSDHITDLQIKRIVVPLLAKISMGVTAPAYTPTPENIAKMEANDKAYRFNNDLMSPEESAAYEIELLGGDI